MKAFKRATFLGVFCFPLLLFAQPQIEWAWTDSVPNSQLNSIVAAADGGVLVSSNSRVVKLSADGVEEWRTEVGGGSICMLNDGHYVLERLDALYFLSEAGVVEDSILLDEPDPDCENGFMAVFNVGSQAKAVKSELCYDYDHWGEFRGATLFISQYNVLSDGTITWGSLLGDFFYSDYVSDFDAKLFSNGRVIYLTARGGDPYKLYSTGSTVWQCVAQPYYSRIWYDPKLLVNDESGFFVVSSRSDYGNDSTAVLVEKFDTSGVRVWTHDLLMRETLQYGILAVAPQSESLNLLVLSSNRYYNNPDDSLVFVLFDNDINIRGTWAVAFDTPTHQTKATVSEGDKVFVARRVDSDTVSFLQVTAFSSDWNVTAPPNGTTPSSFVLHPNYPNPFNPTTEIFFDLPRRTEAKLQIFDLMGREVTTLINTTLNAGTHRVEFNGKDLASGVYFYRLESGAVIETKKMVLLK